MPIQKLNSKEYLIYLIENCINDFDALKKINSELKKAMLPMSETNVDYLGVCNRCVQGYLIIKIASLFDKDNRTISLYNAFNNIFDKIKAGTIIDEIIEARNKFIAHNEFKYLEDGSFGLGTHEITDSSLRDILEQIKQIVKKTN